MKTTRSAGADRCNGSVLAILDFPLPAPGLVRRALAAFPGFRVFYLGAGIGEGYCRESGLETAGLLAVGGGIIAQWSWLRQIRRSRFDAALFIGSPENLAARAAVAASGARKRLFLPTEGEPSPRPIGWWDVAPDLVGRLVLFVLSLPLFLLPRLFLSNTSGAPVHRTGLQPADDNAPVHRTGLQTADAPIVGPVSAFALSATADRCDRASSPPVSVVIPNYNGKELLSKCLPSLEKALAAYPGGGEIVVVDDASSDGSPAWIKGRFSGVRLIALEKNRGFAQACNLGVSRALHRLVVLLNSDIIAEADFLPALVAHFRDPRVFAVQPRMMDWGGEKLNLGVNVGHMENGYIRIWNERETLNPKRLDRAAPTLYAVGGAMAFDRKKWDDLGGFDGLYYPFCWEDIDISYRAWKRGWKVLYEPASVVYHLHHGTIGRFFTRGYKRMVEQRNELIFIWKNIHSDYLRREHLKRLPGRVLATALTGNPEFQRGFLSALLALPRIRRARREEIARAVRRDEDVFQSSQATYGNWVKRGGRFRAEEEKPSVLMIYPVVPVPADDGGKIRVYQMLRNLAGSYDIRLLCFSRDPSDLAGLKELEAWGVKAEAIPLRALPLSHVERAVFPHYCQGWASQEMLDRIRTILRDEPVDLVDVETTLMAYYRNVIEDTPSVFVELDAGPLQPGESYNPAARGLKKIAEWYEWLRMLKFELTQAPRFNLTVAVSKRDEEILRSYLPDLNVKTVTQGTDVEYFSTDSADLPRRIRRDDYHEPKYGESKVRGYENRFAESKAGAKEELSGSTMVFVGALAHYPNVDAINWFAAEVLPRIREKLPEARLVLVGSGSPDRIAAARASPGVEFVGSVPDVRPYLASARIFVAPIRLGSGMKGKVLEALAMGKAVAATEVAASGIGAVSGVHLLIADSARDFAEAAVRLLSDAPLRERLGRAGRELVRERFSWKMKAEETDKLYREVLERIYG